MGDRAVGQAGYGSGRHRQDGLTVSPGFPTTPDGNRAAQPPQSQTRSNRSPRIDPSAGPPARQPRTVATTATQPNYIYNIRAEASGSKTANKPPTKPTRNKEESSDDDDDSENEEDSSESDENESDEDDDSEANSSEETSASSIPQRQSKAALTQNPPQTARYPGPFKGRRAWTGQKLERGCEIIKLKSSDIKSIVSAVSHFKKLHRAIGTITKKQFPVSSELEKKFRDISKEIHEGRGFVTLRGLDKAGFDDAHTEDSTIAFAGITSHVCPERAVSSFSGNNLAIEHIYDARGVTAKQESSGPELPPTKLPTMLRFHADRFNGDVLAMYVRHPGDDDEGEQYVASFTTIYNTLLQQKPATLQVLSSGDWPFIVKPRIDVQQSYPLPGPIMFLNGNRPPICQLVFEPLVGETLVPRPRDAPALSTEQQDALQTVQYLAVQNQYKLERQKGDIQFINNLNNLHARNKYNETGSSRRYLLRMFLRDPQYAYAKPADWAPYFDRPFQLSASGALIEHKDRHPRIAVFYHG